MSMHACMHMPDDLTTLSGVIGLACQSAYVPWTGDHM